MSSPRKIPPGAKRTRAFYDAIPETFSPELSTHFLDKAIDLAAELEEELNQARQEAKPAPPDKELLDAAKVVVEVCYEGRRSWAGYLNLEKRGLVGAASCLCSVVNRRLAS